MIRHAATRMFPLRSGIGVSPDVRRALKQIYQLGLQPHDGPARLAELEDIYRHLAPARQQARPRAVFMDLLHNPRPLIRFAARLGAVALGITGAVALAQVAGAPAIVSGAVEYVTETALTVGLASVAAAQTLSHQQPQAVSPPPDPTRDLVMHVLEQDINQLRHGAYEPNPQQRRERAEFRVLLRSVTHPRPPFFRPDL